MTNDKQRVDFPVGENVREDKRGTPRGRLVELIRSGINKHESTIENYVFPLWEYVADYLLANGVIVPPCKVGDIIWVKDFKRCCVIEEAEITEIVQNKYGTYIRYEYPALRGRTYTRSIEYIGKTVFLTKEEAEQALNNVQNGNSCEEGAE